ncbi:hypothetical protein B0T17DRAFT_124872 [Bombardia bombarda]|uniref:Uncharacterized protein n=1 Tax=Bombardia bombarda TaxID=252184 RepID=A0AA39U348_9PEZI|nr:hypothetical protein B0T17DRAFT_124872 [Bombardia bombarda]
MSNAGWQGPRNKIPCRTRNTLKDQKKSGARILGCYLFVFSPACQKILMYRSEYRAGSRKGLALCSTKPCGWFVLCSGKDGGVMDVRVKLGGTQRKSGKGGNGKGSAPVLWTAKVNHVFIPSAFVSRALASSSGIVQQSYICQPAMHSLTHITFRVVVVSTGLCFSNIARSFIEQRGMVDEARLCREKKGHRKKAQNHDDRFVDKEHNLVSWASGWMMMPYTPISSIHIVAVGHRLPDEEALSP